jgi:multiple sugar transport system permease protein
MLGVVILIWSLAPLYNMLLIALDPEEGEIEFDGNLWPATPSLDSFRDVITQEARYLEDSWHQFGNSVFIGLATMALTVMIGSLASFAVSRMRPSNGSLVTNAALLTYAIPASFLIVPYFRIMHSYGLADNPWAVIAAQVTFRGRKLVAAAPARQASPQVPKLSAQAASCNVPPNWSSVTPNRSVPRNPAPKPMQE